MGDGRYSVSKQISFFFTRRGKGERGKEREGKSSYLCLVD